MGLFFLHFLFFLHPHKTCNFQITLRQNYNKKNPVLPFSFLIFPDRIFWNEFSNLVIAFEKFNIKYILYIFWVLKCILIKISFETLNPKYKKDFWIKYFKS